MVSVKDICDNDHLSRIVMSGCATFNPRRLSPWNVPRRGTARCSASASTWSATRGKGTRPSRWFSGEAKTTTTTTFFASVGNSLGRPSTHQGGHSRGRGDTAHYCRRGRGAHRGGSGLRHGPARVLQSRFGLFRFRQHQRTQTLNPEPDKRWNPKLENSF